MKKNMGSSDRAVRLIAAAVLAYFSFSGIIPGNYAWIGYAVAAVFTATSIISFCPLYTLVGISTCRR